jgi:hypothetical protein
MSLPLRFTPLGQSSSANGFGPILAPEDVPPIAAPTNGPVDYQLTHFRFATKIAVGMDWEYDQNGNLLAVEGNEWLNQQVAKTIQESMDTNGPNPTRGTNLDAAVGQKRPGAFIKDLIASNVRTALLRESTELQSQPGVTDDQVIRDITSIVVQEVTDDPRTLIIAVTLITKSGKVMTTGGAVSL